MFPVPVRPVLLQPGFSAILEVSLGSQKLVLGSNFVALGITILCENDSLSGEYTEYAEYMKFAKYTENTESAK